MDKVLLVALGGAIGSALRYLISGWIVRVSGELALGTFFVNVAGSFLMGAAAMALFLKMPDGMERWAPFAMTGVLGGFTTFSAFSLDAFRLFEEGRLAAAIAYAGGSVVFCVAAVVAGGVIARNLVA